MDFQDKKTLVEKIGTLSKEAHIEIFFLLKKYVPEYTLTRNGAFFNVNQLPDPVLIELKDLVEFCSKNEENLNLTHPDKKNVMIAREDTETQRKILSQKYQQHFDDTGVPQEQQQKAPRKTTARKPRVKK